VNLFSYLLGYSRRQYLYFTESQDFESTLRQHIRAFEHLGEVAVRFLDGLRKSQLAKNSQATSRLLTRRHRFHLPMIRIPQTMAKRKRTNSRKTTPAKNNANKTPANKTRSRIHENSDSSSNNGSLTTPAAPTNPAANIGELVLEALATLRVPVSPEELDAALRRGEQTGQSHLEFLQQLLGHQAAARQQRSIERRIREARFAAVKTLEDFDWEALGRRLCALGYRVRYTTSGALLLDLTASLADRTLPSRIGHWSRFDLLVVDEFGFDRIERESCTQAASLLYKVIDVRSGQRSTALGTNIDFESWAEYLGDPPLAMALLDRVVDGAIVVKLRGKSYRAERMQRGS
jgi:DNA replication protein DnaC